MLEQHTFTSVSMRNMSSPHSPAEICGTDATRLGRTEANRTKI